MNAGSIFQIIITVLRTVIQKLFLFRRRKKEKNGYVKMMELLNLFKPIQDGHFWGCSWMGGGQGQKDPPSLKSVTHILQ